MQGVESGATLHINIWEDGRNSFYIGLLQWWKSQGRVVFWMVHLYRPINPHTTAPVPSPAAIREPLQRSWHDTGAGIPPSLWPEQESENEKEATLIAHPLGLATCTGHFGC